MAATPDPTKHLLGYGRCDPSTGMLRGHIRWPDGRPPSPSGCRWCGIGEREHPFEPTWLPARGFHLWEQPTQRQILARMLTRRAARLVVRRTAKTFRYHAAGQWTAGADGESEGDLVCTDCWTHCHQFWRIQARLDVRRYHLDRAAGFPVPDLPF